MRQFPGKAGAYLNGLALEWQFFWFAAGMSSLGDLPFIHNSCSALVILVMDMLCFAL